MPEPTLWPDDAIDGGIDGLAARMGGQIPYEISGTLFAMEPDLLSTFKLALTELIRARYDGTGPVQITSSDIVRIRQSPPKRFASKFDGLLGWIANRLGHRLKQPMKVPAGSSLMYEMCRVGSCFDLAELRGLLSFMHEKGLVEYQGYVDGMFRVEMTGDRFIYLDDKSLSSSTSRKAFVAMWFSEEMSVAYLDGIKPAIEALGYEPVRIDTKEHANKIDDEIISEIRQAKFVVADFSCGNEGPRGGVYFEAGFALALPKTVIWTVRRSDLPRVHFDTRQFNHVAWDTPADLRDRLERRIGSLIGPFAPAA